MAEHEGIIVKNYVTPEGECPFEAWQESIRDTRTRAKIDIAIANFRSGNYGDSKPVGDGVHGRRIHYGPGYRLYFGNDGKTLIILLCGGTKGSQKKDIKIAQKNWLDYKSRKKDS